MPKDPSKPSKKSSLPIPPPPDRPQQCHFYVARKRRYCGLPAKKSLKYCGEHLIAHPENEIADNLKRVPCPYDNSHTVFEKDLDSHMKSRCNSRPKDNPPCHCLNINCSLPLSEEELEFQKNIFSHQKMYVQPWLARVQLSPLDREELYSFIQKVSDIHDKYVDIIELKQLSHPHLQKTNADGITLKHFDQITSIIGLMDEYGMLKDKASIFAEFGAGRGDLSRYLKNALKEENGEASYLLIDRKSVRNKVDQTLHGRSAHKSTVQRVLIDIKDLVLSKIECIEKSNSRKKVVALSKHLCGCATDITLKCLMNYVDYENTLDHKNPINGIIIALCCHQLCRYEMYPNIEFLDSVGISKTDFERICKMSSWATSSKQVSGQDEDHADIEGEEEDKDDSTNHFSGLDHKQREVIGCKCKRLLDIGRAKFLEKYGFKTKLVYYVDLSSSLENCALIAVPVQSG
ncbi:methyltransferase TRM13-domain-containing protein [Pilobolus umbonatus]|nr:methyltransferase TRM13-domain-containing protein [Pilobolus umbonatus]